MKTCAHFASKGTCESMCGERTRAAAESDPSSPEADARERPLPPLPLPHRVRGGLVPRQGRLRRCLQVREKSKLVVRN